MTRIALILAATAVTPAAAQSVASPDGRNVLTLAIADGQPVATLAVAGRTVLAPSALGLRLDGVAPTALSATGAERRAGRDRYALTVGKTHHIDERYREITVHYAGVGGQKLDLIARAYDTGVALRYRLPAQPGMAPLRIAGELTRFAFPADYACRGHNIGTFTSGHEGEYEPVQASAMSPGALYELPVVCRTGAGGPVMAFVEADVTDWPVAYFGGAPAGSPGLQVRLSPHIGEPALAVTRDAAQPVLSPWRVVMIAPTNGKLIENTLMTSLNPAPVGDFTWVKPGKTSWDWWSGPILGGKSVGLGDATQRAFIDFAGANGFAYHMIDDGWYVNSGSAEKVKPGADPTRTIPDIDMPGLVRYAADRKVGLIVWIHWKLLDRDMERILTQVERWGLKGIKVDFMERDDQYMVGFYHRLAAATARHHLLLDLHGATHPWGMIRTWPNFITQEGVRGAEYNKWTKLVTARNNVALAYTRLLSGPMDYTPGGFRNQTPETFVVSEQGPNTQTTRGAALAMYVVYDSPLQSVADSPDAYKGADGLDFLRAVPTSWDETRFLDGEADTHVAIARRRGDTWYVGAMTAGPAKTLRLPLGFLATRRYAAQVWEDGTSPTTLNTATRPLRPGATLDLALAASGGAVAILTPVR